MDRDGMNIHHVGIVLPYNYVEVFKKPNMDLHIKLFESIYPVGHNMMFKDVKEFSCLCYLYGQVEYVIPYGGKIAKWLEENGPGLHHVAFEVADIRQTSMELKEKGFTLVCDKPVLGVDEMLVNFVHPKDTPHALYEIVEVTSWR